jgi:hypothetical protein
MHLTLEEESRWTINQLMANFSLVFRRGKSVGAAAVDLFVLFLVLIHRVFAP